MSTAAPLTLTARDGRPLAASLFVPAQENGVAVVVNSASAVPRPYYNAFAAFLAERGFTVLTYDYRGVGESRQGPLKREAGRMLDWGTLDQAAAFDWFAQNRPHLALTVVGHSAGGQILGLNDRAAAIRAAYLVAAPHGYWGNWPLHLRPLLLALWYGALPASVALLGYFAGSRMGLG
ncbi:MAG TPA: alpha/beta fold hydrolase, partial [Alphaproteobacteria bacterium]|nr:alpha/beta fold hydrolase [Alphaproteobacteria bacterium]